MIPLSVTQQPRLGTQTQRPRKNAPKVINLEARVQQLFDEHHGGRSKRYRRRGSGVSTRGFRASTNTPTHNPAAVSRISDSGVVTIA